MSYKKLTPVAVIASFDSEGNIKPLYFRYKNERIQVSTKNVHFSNARYSIFL